MLHHSKLLSHLKPAKLFKAKHAASSTHTLEQEAEAKEPQAKALQEHDKPSVDEQMAPQHISQDCKSSPRPTSLPLEPGQNLSQSTFSGSTASLSTTGSESHAVSGGPNQLYGRLAETEIRAGTDAGTCRLDTMADVADMAMDRSVTLRARIHNQRHLSSMLSFVILRYQTQTLQAVLSNELSQDMIQWAKRIPAESLVQVSGILRKPRNPVRSASLHDVELVVRTIHLLTAPRPAAMPFRNHVPVDGADRGRIARNRVLDLRHPTNQAVIRVRAAILREWRRGLDDRGFLEIQTPKLQPAATESGTEVFRLNYFGMSAFLAQSPQLAKQMAVSADFGRVSAPFSAPKIPTLTAHLTEYTGLDLEMTLSESYRELIDVVDGTLKEIFAAVKSMAEVDIVRQRWPSRDLVWLDETPVIAFSDGVAMLRQDGRQLGDDDDLSTQDEIRLGELVREAFHTDYFILDRFPAAVRPFYTKRAAADGNHTNSFDVFLRGQEICTGGQRINDVDKLRRSMANAGLTGNGLEEYLSAFDIGAPPHGGAGLGLERIVMLLLELGDVRHATLFHRDPRSLPARLPSLPHPNAKTTRDCAADAPLPPIEDLIANYGDATNTSWLDDRFEIWRHRNGAAVGYVRQTDRIVVVAGDPLCDDRQYDQVVCEFVHFVEVDLRMHPIWILVSERVQEILARKHRWRTLSCVEEQRVVTDQSSGINGRKKRRVERKGIKMGEVHPDEQFIQRADAAIAQWKQARKGQQVHLTEVRPWLDRRHRRYFAAEKDNRLLALVVLAQLSPRHGWQVKWSLLFPGAPNGSVEVLIEMALEVISGATTFGVGVSEQLRPGANLKGARAKFLAKMYSGIVEALGLARKAEFRERFGVVGEAVWICYPRHGIGVWDLKRVVKFFKD